MMTFAKRGDPLPVNYLTCVKLNIDIPEDGMSIACNIEGVKLLYRT